MESWNKFVKQFINTCTVCGKQGCPSIEEESFVQYAPDKKSTIYVELTTIYSTLKLDELGRCETCAKLMDK